MRISPTYSPEKNLMRGKDQAGRQWYSLIPDVQTLWVDAAWAVAFAVEEGKRALEDPQLCPVLQVAQAA